MPNLEIDLPDEFDLDKRIDKDVFQIEKRTFESWLSDKWGPRPSLVHCDFPYEVGLDTSGQMNTSAFEGNYKDTGYNELCDLLVEAATSGRLADKCHVLFWFPFSKYAPTVRKFHAAGFWFDPYPLIWHKSDNRGIVPDSKRGPRRVYETALLLSWGDYNVVKSVPNAVSLPSESRTKTHASYKPLGVLEHFFKMLVDDRTILFDGTCGSGSSLAAGIKSGAAYVYGCDISPESVEMSKVACLNTLDQVKAQSQKEEEQSDDK